MQNALQTVKKIIPGFLVCAVIAVIAQVLANYIPSIGSALIAILLGILAGNTFLNREVFNAGSKFSEKNLLEYSIVLTGLTLNLTDIMGVGITGVIFILLQRALTITAAYLIGKKLGFGKKFTMLMCAGNAVCGSSAIATVAPVVKAESKDKGISITIVNVTGTFMMILLPLIAGLLYNHETLQTAGLIGGTLQSIGQVIASAKMVSTEVVDMATIFKIIRIIFLVLVALVFSRLNTNEGEKLFSKQTGEHGKVKAGVPWFIIGFFLLSIITSIGFLPQVVGTTAKTISGQFEIIALAAIGMRVKFRDLVKEGPKSMLFGGLVGVCQIIFAVGLIFLLLRPSVG